MNKDYRSLELGNEENDENNREYFRLIANNDYNEAHQYWCSRIVTSASDYQNYFYKAMTIISLYNFEDDENMEEIAKNLFQTVLSYKPNNSKITSLCNFALGIYYTRKNDLNQGRSYFEIAKNYNIQNSYHIGRFLYYHRAFSDALIYLQPNEYQLPKSVYYRGLCYFKKQNYVKAEENFKLYLEYEKTAEIFCYHGLCLYRCERENIAIDSFLEAINLDPKYSSSYLYLGRCYSDLKNNKKAIEIFDEGIFYSPKSQKSNFLYHKSLSFWSLKKYSKAMIEIESAIELAANNNSIYLLCKANYLMKMKNYFQSIVELKKCLEDKNLELKKTLSMFIKSWNFSSKNSSISFRRKIFN